jgi:hypothetical protein
MSSDIVLSVILPGIRVNNWLSFYNSIVNSFSESFEVVIISPYDLPDSLSKFDNVKIIKDFGSPSRCQQIGLIHCEGEFVTWGADDGFFHGGMLDKAVSFWRDNASSDKDIVTCKYFEGERNQEGKLHTTGETELSKDFYYRINHAAGLRSCFIPNDYWILNVGIVKTSYVKDLGGWDTRFEATAVSHTDFAVRTQRDGSRYFMLEKPIFSCTHMPGTSGDHAPIHFAHLTNDEPLFRKIYNSSGCMERTKIKIDNWKNSPDIWKRRFNNV